jgi:hypothetical protein
VSNFYRERWGESDPTLPEDMVTRLCDTAHAAQNAERVGHRDGFCLACAEITVAYSTIVGEHD